MDLLSDESSSCSKSDDDKVDNSNGTKRALNGEGNKEEEHAQQEQQGTSAFASALPTQDGGSKKRQRGSVVVLPSDRAPADAFQRSVPHKRGHWAGHVLVPVNATTGRVAAMKRSILHFQQTLESNGYSGTIIQHSHLHISLSKFFSMQLAFIEPFVHKLTQRLQAERASRLLVVDGENTILVNDEKTRSFLSWKIQSTASLLRIVRHVDAVLEEYNQPPYYVPPIFHISLASFAANLEGLDITSPGTTRRDASDATLADNEDEDDHRSSSSNDDCSNSDEEEVSFLVVKELVCKFGTTKSYTIPLASS